MPNWKKVIVSGSDASLTSLNVINGVTGSLFGTSSWANNATTSSYILNAVSASFSSTASFVTTAQTASFVTTAQTASYVLQAVSASFATSASTAVTSSYANATSTIGYTIGGSQIYYNSTASSTSPSTSSIFINNTGSFTSAFYNYTVYSGSNARAGQISAVWVGNSISYNDYSTIDIGSTLAVTASVAIVTGQVQLNVAVPASSTGWNVKATATYL